MSYFSISFPPPMMDPSYSAGMVWLHIHWFFGSFAIVGFILLTVWALRNLRKETLKTLTLWLLVVGIVGTIVTAPLAMAGAQWIMQQLRGEYTINMDV